MNENSNEDSSTSRSQFGDPLSGGNDVHENQDEMEHATEGEVATEAAALHDSLDEQNNGIMIPDQSNLSNNYHHHQHQNHQSYDQQNGGSVQDNDDPFANTNHDNFVSNEDLNALLQSNALENGDTPPPTLLDEDANDLLNQLVGFQASKDMQSTNST